MYSEEDTLLLSGIQHFLFCPRQWALIHIEHQWKENVLTVEGDLLHDRVHDNTFDEKRRDRLIIRGMPVSSAVLGVRGVCDAVEFHFDESGVPLVGREGTWRPVPIEYKHGAGAAEEADAAQLCLQGMCLAEMLCCDVASGYVYHAAEHRREEVIFDAELCERVCAALEEMHRLFTRGHTPKVRKRPGCRSCSLKELCLPTLEKSIPVKTYIAKALSDAAEDAL